MELILLLKIFLQNLPTKPSLSLIFFNLPHFKSSYSPIPSLSPIFKQKSPNTVILGGYTPHPLRSKSQWVNKLWSSQPRHGANRIQSLEWMLANTTQIKQMSQFQVIFLPETTFVVLQSNRVPRDNSSKIKFVSESVQNF